MTWLRSKARRLSLLALFALALQFGLSFGHFHNDLGIASAAASQSLSSTPDTNHDRGLHHDLCAICSSVAMTASALAADTPPLPLPISFSNTQTAFDSETITPDERRGAFRSRAPPRS